MNPTSIFMCRRLLQVENISEINKFLPPATTGDPTFEPINASSSSTAAARRPFNPTDHFDSSMALTVLVLLTALFFMGFFSVYIRRLNAAAAAAAAADLSPPSTATASRGRPPPPNRKGGLDPAAVGSLPLVTYCRAAKHRMIDECPICLTEFEERETVKLIPYCGHVFHGWCIDTWLSSHMTCPLCRSSQLFNISDDALGLFGSDTSAHA
ncbi:hypothetical protein CASFOL_035049 [Castilleja foliolosa]|uniref:RING-type E3 ubiquitin transferase n=1 Tax=Castilleja foliolosa TaxID=1961234 RepID=A0ABD3BS98_9LAMI